MGLIKNIINTATKDVKNANYQWKAIRKAEKIQEGEKVLPPKHPREAEQFEKTSHDEQLKKMIDRKDDQLIDNVNKINIRSTDPPERWTRTKVLPTRESEWEHRNDPVWEFGFYEPPPEKMEKNRLMLKEALELLRNRMEAELPGPNGEPRKFREEAQQKYAEHPAVSRVDEERLEKLWTYFRPFERHEKQRLVRKSDLLELEATLEGRSENIPAAYEAVLEALRDKSDQLHRSPMAKKLLQMSEQEKQEFVEEVTQAREAEKHRLEKRLEEMKLLTEEEVSKDATVKEKKD